MTTPKEALEHIQVYFTETYNGDPLTPEYRDEMENIIKAAIPIAELEHQAADLLEDAPPHSRLVQADGMWGEKVRQLNEKLEALKAEEE